MIRQILLTVGIILFTIGATLALSPSKEASKLNQEGTKELKVLKKEKETLQKKLDEKELELSNIQAELETLQEQAKANDEESVEEKKPKKATTKIVITIEDGVRSPDVAVSLAEANIIDDAKKFNDFLKEKGYASKIQLGTYEIDPAMDYDTIAKIITKHGE